MAYGAWRMAHDLDLIERSTAVLPAATIDDLGFANVSTSRYNSYRFNDLQNQA